MVEAALNTDREYGVSNKSETGAIAPVLKCTFRFFNVPSHELLDILEMQYIFF